MIKSFEAYKWGRWYDKETDDFLHDAFAEYIYPTQIGYKPATAHRTKSGYNMMLFWNIDIPINGVDGDINKLIVFLEGLAGLIDQIKLEIPHLGHQTKIGNDKVTISLWNKSDD